MRSLLVLLACLCSLSSGCTLFQHLAPHQLWKLNRQQSLGGEDDLFSVPAASPAALADPFASAPAPASAPLSASQE